MLHSVMGLSLDHTTYNIPPPSWVTSNISEKHVHVRSPAQSALDSHLHAIRGTPQNVSNRFFDKALTLIVDPSTRAGASGEHSPVDALVPSIVAEYGLVQGVDAEAFEPKGAEVNDVDGRGWERLDWVGDAKIWKECGAATERANKIMNDSDDSVLWYEKYGTEWIKSVGESWAALYSHSYLNIIHQATTNSHLMHIYRWHFNLRGIRHAASSPQRMRPS